VKYIRFIALIGLTLLVACSSAPTATPVVALATPTPQIIEVTATPWLVTATPQPTDTTTVTPTSTPTSTPTQTPTSIPTISVRGLIIPDPRATNPELFDLQRSDAPIPLFVNAMKMGGIELNAEKVSQGLQYETLKDLDNTQFVVAYSKLDPNPQTQGEPLEGLIPLLIAKPDGKGGWIWKEAMFKELADPINFHIGTGVGGFGFAQYYAQMVRTQTRGDFNLALLAVGPRWNEQLSPPPPGPIFYKYLDSDVNIAYRAGMVGYGHLVLWGVEAPQWLRQGKYTRDQVIAIMQDSIRSDMTRYKNKIKYWDVVNEAYVTYGAGDAFLQKIGPDYVETAFRTAREADPFATLLYNDYDNHTLTLPRTAQTKAIVDNLKSKGLIDMVGLETILFYPNIPTKQQLIDGMRNYGVPVIITEFGVNMAHFSGSQQAKYMTQAKVYYDVISAALESGVCKDFIFFLPADAGNFWTESSSGLQDAGPANAPAPFDGNFQPKPAYYASRMALLNYLSAIQK
jgi:endo-1,4-beta-xylanase